jgi:hypothetical protein
LSYYRKPEYKRRDVALQPAARRFASTMSRQYPGGWGRFAASKPAAASLPRKSDHHSATITAMPQFAGHWGIADFAIDVQFGAKSLCAQNDQCA